MLFFAAESCPTATIVGASAPRKKAKIVFMAVGHRGRKELHAREREKEFFFFNSYLSFLVRECVNAQPFSYFRCRSPDTSIRHRMVMAEP